MKQLITIYNSKLENMHNYIQKLRMDVVYRISRMIVANRINKMTGNKSGIVYKQRRDWDKAIRRRASIEKAKRILGYEPKTEIKAGLRKVHEWFKENWENIEKSVKF